MLVVEDCDSKSRHGHGNTAQHGKNQVVSGVVLYHLIQSNQSIAFPKVKVQGNRSNSGSSAVNFMSGSAAVDSLGSLDTAGTLDSMSSWASSDDTSLADSFDIDASGGWDVDSTEEDSQSEGGFGRIHPDFQSDASGSGEDKMALGGDHGHGGSGMMEDEEEVWFRGKYTQASSRYL